MKSADLFRHDVIVAGTTTKARIQAGDPELVVIYLDASVRVGDEVVSGDRRFRAVLVKIPHPPVWRTKHQCWSDSYVRVTCQEISA